MDKIPVSFEHNGTYYEGFLKPLDNTWQVVLNGVFIGYLTCEQGNWTMDMNEEFATFLGDYLIAWYQ